MVKIPLWELSLLDDYIATWSDPHDRIRGITGSHLIVVDNQPSRLLPDLEPELIDSVASRQIAVDDSDDKVVTRSSVDLSEPAELRPRLLYHEVLVIQRVEFEIAK